MKVVFIEEVPGTAVPGDVKDVKDGFARNFLLPRKLALPATKATMQKAESLSKKEEKRQAGLDREAQAIVEKLDGKQILIRARVGEQGRLYGSVTSADIATHLDELLGEPIDRRRIMMAMPIREIGSRAIPLRLTRNVTASVEVVIEADESSSRGRRSTAPAGGSEIMSPTRERPRRRFRDDEDEDQFDDDRDDDGVRAERDESDTAVTAGEPEPVETEEQTVESAAEAPEPEPA